MDTKKLEIINNLDNNIKKYTEFRNSIKERPFLTLKTSGSNFIDLEFSANNGFDGLFDSVLNKAHFRPDIKGKIIDCFDVAIDEMQKIFNEL